MGVGKGVKIGDVSESRTSRRLDGRMTGNRRRPKKWHSKTFYAESMRLGELIRDNYARRVSIVVEDNIDKVIQ